MYSVLLNMKDGGLAIVKATGIEVGHKCVSVYTPYGTYRALLVPEKLPKEGNYNLREIMCKMEYDSEFENAMEGYKAELKSFWDTGANTCYVFASTPLVFEL